MSITAGTLTADLITNKELRVAFLGKARAGKDFSKDMLVNQWRGKHLGEPCISSNLSFAQPLKDLYYEYFSHLDNTEKPRDAFVKIGNTFRDVDPMIWIMQMDEQLQEVLDEEESLSEHSIITWNSLYTITDLRYPNEAQWCRDNGFTIVKVETDDAIRLERSAKLGETLELGNEGDAYVDLILPDFVIDGNGLQSTLDGIDNVLHKLGVGGR